MLLVRTEKYCENTVSCFVGKLQCFGTWAKCFDKSEWIGFLPLFWFFSVIFLYVFALVPLSFKNANFCKGKIKGKVKYNKFSTQKRETAFIAKTMVVYNASSYSKKYILSKSLDVLMQLYNGCHFCIIFLYYFLALTLDSGL